MFALGNEFCCFKKHISLLFYLNMKAYYTTCKNAVVYFLYTFLAADAVDYCSANPNDIIPTSDNCAQYYNCSQNQTKYQNHVMECKYPELLSTATLMCEHFTAVSCYKRMEPQAPCK